MILGDVPNNGFPRFSNACNHEKQDTILVRIGKDAVLASWTNGKKMSIYAI